MEIDRYCSIGSYRRLTGMVCYGTNAGVILPLKCLHNALITRHNALNAALNREMSLAFPAISDRR